MLSNDTMHIKGYENTNNVNLNLYIMCKKGQKSHFILTLQSKNKLNYKNK